MHLRLHKTQDVYVYELVEHICAKICAKFPEATFEVSTHPSQRGAIIDAHVPTDDDFSVFDLINSELDELLLAEDIAIYCTGSVNSRSTRGMRRCERAFLRYFADLDLMRTAKGTT